MQKVFEIYKTWNSEAWSYTLPNIVDDEGDSVTLTKKFGLADGFVALDAEQLVIDDISSPKVKAGFYSLQLLLNDGTQQMTATIQLFIFDPVGEPDPEEEEPEEIHVLDEDDCADM